MVLELRRSPMKFRKATRFKNSAVKPLGRVRLRRLVRWSIAILAVVFISLGLVLVQTYRSYARIVDARLAHGYLISRAGIYAAPAHCEWLRNIPWPACPRHFALPGTPKAMQSVKSGTAAFR
mgnify:CR=1 FL=1